MCLRSNVCSNRACYIIMTTIVFCSSIDYVTITTSIIIRHNNDKLIKHSIYIPVF